MPTHTAADAMPLVWCEHSAAVELRVVAALARGLTAVVLSGDEMAVPREGGLTMFRPA
jgi:hypothetical protein